MLREMTDSAFAHSFKRFARLAVVGFALVGLTACGGGGGGTTPTTPEITITPTPAPTEAELEAATVISAGETVTGTLESADDVKYYELDVAETSLIELTIDAEAGTEIALLDSSGGAVLGTAVTASEGILRHVVTKGKYYVRVLHKKLKKANQSTPFRLLNKVTKITAVAGTVINVLRGELKGTIPLGPNAAITFDLTETFSSPDDQPLTFKFGGSLGPWSATIEKEVLRLTPNDAQPGPITLTVTATHPDVANIPKASVPLRVILVRPGRVKPEYQDGVRVSVDAGMLAYASPQLGNYFEFPAGSELSYRLQGALMGEPGFVVEGARWHLAQGTDRLSVVVASGQSLPVMTDATVIARDQHGTEARLRLFITFPEVAEPGTGGMMPGGGEGVAFYCNFGNIVCTGYSGGVPTSVCTGEGLGRVVAQCPRRSPGVLCYGDSRAPEVVEVYRYYSDISSSASLEREREQLSEATGVRCETF